VTEWNQQGTRLVINLTLTRNSRDINTAVTNLR